jgi:hypothetical protein
MKAFQVKFQIEQVQKEIKIKEQQLSELENMLIEEQI